MNKVKCNPKNKNDIETLIAFRDRIIEVQENPTSNQVDVLKIVQSTYSLMRIVLSDADAIETSNKIVQTFIDDFLKAMEQSICCLQQRTKSTLVKQLS